MISKDGERAFVASSRANALDIVNLKTGQLETRVSIDNAPYDIVLSPDEKTAWVSTWGGKAAEKDELTQGSSDTPIRVEPQGVIKSSSVVCIDLTKKLQTTRINVGPLPTQLLLASPTRLYVACANADEVAVIDPTKNRVVDHISVKLDKKLAFGSMPNGLAINAGSTMLYVANGGNNAIAVVSLTGKAQLKGFIPAGWYPTSLIVEGNSLIIASAKGLGSRGKKESKHSAYDHTGTVQSVKLPDDKTLQLWTKQASDDALAPQALLAMERRSKATPKAPIPARLGEPSPIEHVVYIIKENRTYDQVFGDMKQGDGDPNLVTYGREVTPNHHAIAEQFVLLDNYYCNGVLSADGHSWATEGNATSYIERSFGGFTRSYPAGDDPLAISPTGFIWDHILAAGLSFRNYGEFYSSTPPKGKTYKQIYDDWKAGKEIEFTNEMGTPRLPSYSNPKSPGWQMNIPDQVRADVFLKEFKSLELMPALTIIYLPQDHTSGTTPGGPTPRACVSDNDLAVGRIVDALSHSKWWSKLAIFINEDDAQNGFDHVDGHRSLCLVISPYAKRGKVVSSFQNQSGVLHTICQIFGISPLNNMVALSPIMADCFTDKADLTPYTCKPNIIALDELNPARSAMTPNQIMYADLTAKQDLSVPDRINENAMNRIQWASAHPMRSYPAEFAGPHGRGLKKRNLTQASAPDDDD